MPAHGYPTPRHQGDLNERWWLSGINIYVERQQTPPQVYVVLECKQTGCETQWASHSLFFNK